MCRSIVFEKMCGKIERNVTKALLWTIKNNYEQYNGDNTFSDDDRVVIDGLVTKHVPSITTEWAVSLWVGFRKSHQRPLSCK